MFPGLSSEESRDLILSVGTRQQKRRLSPSEAGRLLARSRDSGASLKQLAELLRLRDTGVVSELIGLLRLESSLQDLVDWGRSSAALSFSAAREISRLPLEEQGSLSELALEKALTKDELQQIVTLHLRTSEGEGDLPKLVGDVVARRKVVERQYVFVGRLTDSALVSRLAIMSQSARDALLQTALQAALPRLADRGLEVWSSYRLAPEQVVLATMDAQAAEALHALERGFEAELQAHLDELTK